MVTHSICLGAGGFHEVLGLVTEIKIMYLIDGHGGYEYFFAFTSL
jgi:hypothetical protein